VRHRDEPARRPTTGTPTPLPLDARVYPPREDSHLLLPFTKVRRGSSFLDIGTGSGFLALAAARRGAHVVATDRNPHALAAVRRRARAERLDVAPVRTDFARGLGRFDRIVANPPYLPTAPAERDPDRWHNLALDGGPDGTDPTARLVDDLDAHLAPGGSAFLLTSSRQSPSHLRAIWTSWRAKGGTRRRVAARRLEGETLTVYRLAGPGRRATRRARRTPSPRRGTRGRPRTRRDHRSG
jgi:release factor glutamine methyltransferase